MSDLTQAEATDIVDKVAAGWSADDVAPLEELLGADGVFIAITGVEYGRDTVAGWLDPILAAVGDTERTGDPIAVTDGFSFPIVVGGGPFRPVASDIYLVITRSLDGVLTIQESATAP